MSKTQASQLSIQWLKKDQDSREKSQELLEERHQLLNHLSKNGIAVYPSVGPTVTSVPFQSVNVSRIDEAESSGRELDGEDPDQVSRAAVALASLHKLTAGYTSRFVDETSFVKTFHQQSVRFRNEINELAASLNDLKITGSMRLFQRMIVQVEPLIAGLTYDTLPKQIIHGNYRRSNVTFENEESVTILDLDHAKYEARVLDVAIAIADLVPGAYDSVFIESARTFFESYDEILSLDDAEKRALVPLVIARTVLDAFQTVHQIASSLSERESRLHAGRFRGLVSRVWWLIDNWNTLESAFEGSDNIQRTEPESLSDSHSEPEHSPYPPETREGIRKDVSRGASNRE